MCDIVTTKKANKEIMSSYFWLLVKPDPVGTNHGDKIVSWMSKNYAKVRSSWVPTYEKKV
jgi:hypothetical protein